MKYILLLSLVFSVFPAMAQHISSLKCPSTKNSNSILWDGAEHMYLGDVAYKKMCAEMNPTNVNCLVKFPRFDKRAQYTYGQMTALGDFYESGDHMFEENGVGNIAEGGLQNIFRCMDKEARVMHEQRTYPETKFPDCDWVYSVNSKQYLSLAKDNFDHFSWGAVKAYVREHDYALRLAKNSYEMKRQNKPKSADYYFRRAVFVNAVADHYLMDLFAAGHIDIPRRQVRQLAERKLSGFFKKLRGDTLSMILHENNSLDENHNEVGLSVENAQGFEWVTHSDGHMMSCASFDDPIIVLPVSAVKTSVEELFKAANEGQMAEVFAALDLVPRSNQLALADKYSYVLKGDKNQVQQNLNQLGKSLPLPLRWIISNSDIALLIRNISQVTEAYNREINGDLATSALLKKRISERNKLFWLAPLK